MVEALSFSALPTRPPTPPRSSSFNSAASKADIQQLPSNQAPNSTPNNASSPLDLSPYTHSGSQSKRVNFSPLTSYIKPPSFTHSNNRTRTPLRALPPSNQCRPSKSILKTSCSSPASTPSDEQSYSSSENFPAMLESVSQQLAGESRASRADAYQHLLGALTAYSNVPDENALAEKVELFSQCIRRDLCEVSSIYQPLDIKLVRQVLNLLAMFIFKPNLSSRLSEDLKHFIVDHSVSSLQNPNIPKIVAIEYMRVLSVQNFSPKVMTSSRVTQLLNVLKDITDRVDGKAVVAQRLAIYERLLFLPQSAMASQADLWMDHLITALLHNFKEVRTRAIKFGKLAAMALGPNAAVSSALRGVLDVTLENGSQFVMELCGRLAAMIPNPESGPHVPQIWSVVILLLRNRRWSVDQWSHVRDWLLVVQKCFNCSDLTTKSQALMAWDLFVYALPPCETTGKDTTKLLFRPILSQLERKKSDKQGILLNQAFTSYHKLLYYAFRPSASHSRLDLFWTVYIRSPFSGSLNSEPTNNGRLCRILSSLLWNQQPRIWEEDKIKITKGTNIGPEDLPRLDCKWVRSRLSIILPVFESLFKTSTWGEGVLQESHIGLAWTNLSKALADASSKEITPSSESMQALASMLGTLQRIWKTAPLSLNAGAEPNDAFCNRFHFLLTTVISSIGSNPFTDKLLLKTSQETFQTANTPTHNRRPQDSNIRSPMLHLLHLITLSQPLTTCAAYHRLIRSMIEIGVKGRTSRNARLEALRQFADLCLERLANVAEVNSTDLAPLQYVCQTVSEMTKECLAAFPVQTEIKNHDDSGTRDYEKIVAILAAGCAFDMAASEWSHLLDTFGSIVRVERGENAFASNLEMLSEAVRPQPLAAAVSCCAALLDQAKFSATQEQSPSPLRPAMNKPTLVHRQIRPQPHLWNHLIGLLNRVLKETYQKLAGIDHARVVGFLDSTARFLDRCPSSFGPTLLAKSQDFLGLWLTDRDGLLATRSDVDDSVIGSARSVIRSTANLLQKSAESDHTLLQILAPLITSGLESRHKSTVNIFIKLWNNSFGPKETLEYPKNVETALRRLKPFVYLLLPNFPAAAGTTVHLASPEYLSSQEEFTKSETPIKLLDHHSKLFRGSSVSPSQNSTTSSTCKNRRRKKSATSSSKVSTPKTRLRHDDSQIQFVPVESSPALDTAGGSQVLTDNQREVRDRQHGETAKMYPGLRSSASQLGQDTGLPQPAAESRDLDRVESAPPTATLQHAITTNDEEFLGSSPTPMSKNSVAQPDQIIGSSLSSVLDITDLQSDGPPSSPPQIQSHDNGAIPSETKRICEIKYENITMNGDFSSPPRSSPTPASGDTIRRRSSLSSKKSERKTSKSKNILKPDVSKLSISSINQQAEDSNMVPPNSDSDFEKEHDASRSRTRTPTTERDRIDIIPDSFSDDLERQIASQLEQDLELSIDADVGDGGKQAADPSVLTRSMKRKRDDTSSSQHDRAKRVSPNRRPSMRIEVVASEDTTSRPENAPGDNDGTLSKRSSRSRRKANSTPNTQETTNTSQDSGKASHSPGKRKSTKRRSQRLSGQSAPADLSTPHQTSPDSEMVESHAADVEMRDEPEPSVSNEAAPGRSKQEDESGEAENTGAGILASLRSVLGSIKTATFGRSVHREIDDVMFDIKVEAHNAVRRYNGDP